MSHNGNLGVVHNILYKLVGTSGNQQIHTVMAGKQFINFIVLLCLQKAARWQAAVCNCLINDSKKNFIGGCGLTTSF